VDGHLLREENGSGSKFTSELKRLDLVDAYLAARTTSVGRHLDLSSDVGSLQRTDEDVYCKYFHS
jgi:hypothetical protein